jgi:hypothetical protein
MILSSGLGLKMNLKVSMMKSGRIAIRGTSKIVTHHLPVERRFKINWLASG